jgi:hypothetical protein
LTVDLEKGTTDAYIDGKHMETLINDCNDEGGIQLLCQSNEVFVTAYSVIAGRKF